MKTRFLSTVPLLFVLLLALIFGFIETQKQTDYFSIDSLKSLRVLNEKHQMVVDDLFAIEAESPLIAELFQANALIGIPMADRKNKGLIVTLDKEISSEGMLLLQPVIHFTDLELKTIAEEYQDSIPEFEAVELDQEVELVGPVFKWSYPAKKSETVELSSLDSTSQDLIRIAVVDSGVDSGHEIFSEDPVVRGWNTFSDDTSMYDDVGHGTHVAGIIAAEAKTIEIIPYKIVDANGGKLSNVIEALSKAFEDEVDIINMSFGVSSPSPALEDFVEKAYDNQVIMVAAAGNNDKDSGFYPAQYENTLAVASTDALGGKLENSNYGSWVDVAAYGYRIRSSLPNNAYGYKTGTSQSTAKVSAKVAKLLSSSSKAKLSLEEVLSGLKSQGSAITEGKLAGVTRIP